ncbi:MAG TPA: hypothetical protein PKX59_08600 [Bacteroidia bacterium]|nr:hypothetical protein [Bacteroidia bacterium]
MKNDYSLNILGGYSLGTRKIEVGGVLNINRSETGKLQLAGLANFVGGKVSGIQMAGLTNLNQKGFKGIQSAGFLNMNQDSCKGIQLAGFLNLNKCTMEGFQAAGFANINAASEQGVMLSGFSNMNKGNYTGVQAAGFGNSHKGGFYGVQASGFYNSTKGSFEGLQLAGFLNYAQTIKGVQIAFINFSDSCKGVPIGFFNYVKSGYYRLELATDEQLNIHISLRSGTQQFYTLLAATSQVTSLQGKKDIWSFGYGLGTAFQVGKKMQVNLDLIAHQYALGNSLALNQNYGNLLLNLDYRIAKRISIFVGPVLNVALLTPSDTKNYTTLSNNVPSYAKTDNLTTSHQLRYWLGGKCGIRFL